MRATGIVRRIDDLGRVVIPREIRKVLRIQEGDPLEMFIDRDSNTISIKKFQPPQLDHEGTAFTKGIFESTGFPVVITDTDSIIAVSGLPIEGFKNRLIHDDIVKLIKDKVSITNYATILNKLFLLRDNDELKFPSYVIAPIVADGDAVGSVIILSNSRQDVSSTELAIAKSTAQTLKRLIEG